MGARQKITEPLLNMPRAAKRLLAVGLDITLAVFTVWAALCLRLEEWVRFEPQHLWYIGVSVGLATPIFTKFGLYHAIFRYSGWNALLMVSKANLLYGFLYALVFTVVSVPELLRSMGIIQPVLFFIAVATSRVMVGYWFGDDRRFATRNSLLPGVLIYGAGETGRQLLAALDRGRDFRVLGFLDDSRTLQGNRIDGRVVYNPANLNKLISRLEATDIWLAMPSIGRQRRNEILNDLGRHNVHVRTVPTLSDLLSGRVRTTDVRELDIEDLLGRDPVAPNPELMNRHIMNKTVMITGAGGSIGSELCRQIVACKPKRVLLVEQSEFALYNIHAELQAFERQGIAVVPLLASVRDQITMDRFMSIWRPETVYHAAAYKHVPLVEHNIAQGLMNNIWGTLNCAQSAARSGVQNFVLISTDKAVRPTNVMGASKRVAEMVLQALAHTSQGGGHSVHNTCFSMVRFGNVLGSSGSVVPLFRSQIKEGGPITLTHQDITRYFMTIPEAAQLVIQAAAMSKGGDVFVLDMGQPVRIYDLARRMVELSGLTVQDQRNPQGDIEIQVTGLRPGEKLYEELLIGDNPENTNHPRIMKAHESFLPWEELQGKLQALQRSLESENLTESIGWLQNLVSGYTGTAQLVDWLYQESNQATTVLK